MYCPVCESPLVAETECSCECCGWLGDPIELLIKPRSNFNLVQNAAKALDLYRDMCRQELVAEQLGIGPAARSMCQHIKHSLLDMFVKLKIRPNLPDEVLYKLPNGLLPWPSHWPGDHDMLIGNCKCGKYHRESDEDIQLLLAKHRAVVV